MPVPISAGIEKERIRPAGSTQISGALCGDSVTSVQRRKARRPGPHAAIERRCVVLFAGLVNRLLGVQNCAGSTVRLAVLSRVPGGLQLGLKCLSQWLEG